jgi:hypothetical protein
VSWNIVLTPDAERWFMDLDQRDANRIAAAIDVLQEHGPGLGRPVVDSVKGSRHHNMKELRSRGGHLRALFAFDPSRTAVVLMGGDKTNDWTGWYRHNVPGADRLYDQHLKEGGWGSQGPSSGRLSGGRGR